MAFRESIEPGDVGRLLRRLSHDLRTPLGSISIWVHLCRTSADPEERARALARIEAALEAAVRSANDLSECAALLAGEAAPVRTTIGLAGLVLGAFDSLRARGAPPAAALAIEPPATGDEVRVEAEPERLARALEALLAHAARHLAPGGRLGVTLEADSDSAWLAIPLDPGAWSAIRPLRDAISDAAEATGGGSSIALSLAWEVVAAHGGALSHRESPEGGTLVIRLPRAGP
jgi:signal transduction histidine kinase